MKSMRMVRRQHQDGFSLIELLTVTVVIAMLASILLANYRNSLGRTNVAACEENLRNIGTSIQTYAVEYNGNPPPGLSRLTPNYIQAIPTCPAAVKDTYTGGYSVTYGATTDQTLYTIACSGNNHRDQGLTSNQPYFTLNGGLGP